MSERAFIYLDCTPQSKPLSRLIPATPGDFARVAIHFPNGCLEFYASTRANERGQMTRGAVQVRYGPPPGAAGHWTEIVWLSVEDDGTLKSEPQYPHEAAFVRRTRWDR